MIDPRTMTYAEYLWARAFAALEAAYPKVAPAPGRVSAAALVKAYEAHHPWVLR